MLAKVICGFKFLSGFDIFLQTHPMFVFVSDKHGCHPQSVTDLYGYIVTDCPSLKCLGLMTIGAFDHDLTKGPNPDFEVQ